MTQMDKNVIRTIFLVMSGLLFFMAEEIAKHAQSIEGLRKIISWKETRNSAMSLLNEWVEKG